MAAVLLLLLAGCSGKDKKPEPSISEISSALLSSDVFSEPLETVDSSVGIAVFELNSDDIESAEFYMSSGATAEELAVFKLKSSDSVKALTDALGKRIKMQSDSFASYKPSEVPKLEKAEIRTSGSTVAYCVSENSEAAAKLLDKYF